MNVPRGARVVVATLVGLASGLVAPSLRAERTGIGVRYSAPSGCPTELEFLDNVRRRSPRVTAASALDPPQFLVTVAEGVSPRFSGKLERVTQTGAIGVREISGDSCREVTDALALITALTADLTLATLPSNEFVAQPDKGAAPPKEALAEDQVIDRSNPPSDSTPRASNLRWQVGLEGLFASGVTPNPLGGFTMFGEGGGRSSGFWVPSVRLSASLGVSSWSSETTTAHAEFLWAVASLDACALRLGDPLALSAQPCARVTAGLLRASGSGRATPHKESVLWSDAGALVRVHWQLQRALFLDGEAEVFVPGVGYDFDFKNPTDTAEVAGTVGFRFGAGIGIVFR